RVTIETDRGPIVMELDPRLAPNTVNNFVSLARDGFYDGLTFHRVVPEFVIQGGDPEGTGRGGPDYRFADEPVRGEYTEGAAATPRRLVRSTMPCGRPSKTASPCTPWTRIS